MLQKCLYKLCSNSYESRHEYVLEDHPRERILHSYDAIVIVACDMKPCARVDKGRIPTLQDIIRINQVGPQAMQCITCLKASKLITCCS